MTGSNGGEVHSVERVDRLHVVVAVDEDRRRALGMEPVAVDDRVAGGLADLDVLDARRPQRVGEPLGRGAAVRGVGRDRGDARDPQERLVGRRAARRGSRRGGRRGRRSGRSRAASVEVVGRGMSGHSTAREIERAGRRRPARRVARGIRARSGRLRVRLGDRLAWADDRRRAVPVLLRRQVAEQGLEVLGVDGLLGDELLGEGDELVLVGREDLRSPARRPCR